jgi:type II secretory ATPase GspE/PulE/Tfp pilus assembly ATPase PilB-like protein
LNFAAALRSFLRQDPDTIMVGEVRDFETAEIAVKAALTGHMVLTTLHTNDAPATITRLLNMGIEPFLVTAAVNVIIAQRLGRRRSRAGLERRELRRHVGLNAPPVLLQLLPGRQQGAAIGRLDQGVLTHINAGADQ